MAFRRPRSLCLFCQCRQSVIGRRRISNIGHHSSKAKVDGPLRTDGFFSDNNQLDGKETKDITSTLGTRELDGQDQHTATPEEDTLSFEALSTFRDMRQKVLRRLRNPWPDIVQFLPHNHNYYPGRKQDIPLLADLSLPEANAASIPHATFRSLILQEKLHEKQIRRVLRAQLLRCQCPKDIYRILAVCMQTKYTSQNLAVLWEPLIRALYRCRYTVTDPEVLNTLNVIISRLTLAGLYVSPYFFFLGLRFAARTRSVKAMQRYLRHLRQAGIPLHANVFRSVIAKFSIGHRGLGEIRNGRWRRSDLLQVLKGFDDCTRLPPEQQYHLGSFLDRHDWQFLHGWVAVLARCRDSDGVWHEWELWKKSSARLDPRKLGKGGRGFTTRGRGDYWFVEQMTHSGDLERAWKIVDESQLDFARVKGRVKIRLLDGVEYATARSWEGGAREAMVEKYDAELAKIEKALGIQWSAAGGGDEEGVHELVCDQWDVLDELGADDWKFEEDYGYPYDSGSLVPETEDRELHQAEERGRVGQDSESAG